MIEIQTLDTVAIIRVSGDLTMDYLLFGDYIEKYKNYSKLIIEFSAESFIGSTVVGILISQLKKKKDNIFIVATENSQIDRMIKVAFLQDIFNIHYSFKDCMDHLMEEK